MSNLLFDILFAAAVMPAWVGVVLTVSPMLFFAVLIGWWLRGRTSQDGASVESLTDALPWLAEQPEPEVPARRRHRYPLATYVPEPDWVPALVLGQMPAIVLPPARPQSEATTVVIRLPDSDATAVLPVCEPGRGAR